MRKGVFVALCLIPSLLMIAACAPKHGERSQSSLRDLEANANQKKDRKAIIELAFLYTTGTGGEPRDFDKARDLYAGLASQGDLEAQLELGDLCTWHLSDYPCALTWYGKAADQGSAVGVQDLAYLYEHGLGVPKDAQKADALYNKVKPLSPAEREQRAFMEAMKGALSNPQNFSRAGHDARAGGIAVVQFEYIGGGKATDVSIYKSSGSDFEDAEAVKAVEAAVLPERPGSMSEIHHFLIAVNFNRPY